jgi:hypothetical protein
VSARELDPVRVPRREPRAGDTHQAQWAPPAPPDLSSVSSQPRVLDGARQRRRRNALVVDRADRAAQALQGLPGRGASAGAEEHNDVNELPEHARLDAQRVLARAARRLLEARLDGDPLAATPGLDDDPVDDGPDEVTLLVKREDMPVVGADSHRRGNGSR